MTLMLALAAAPRALAGEPTLALLGLFPRQRNLEVEAARTAVDDSNALRVGPRLRLEVFNTGGGEAATLAAARRLAADPDVLAVVVHGEDGVAPGPLKVLLKAHLAVVAASSWAQPRTGGSGVTWLCPDLDTMARIAALYAREDDAMRQIAVVDDGSATSTAAARIFAARFRSAGGKVPYIGTWDGEDDSLTDTVQSMAPQWPQMVFYTGDARSAGNLLLAMRKVKSLRNANLLGLPPIFSPAFFDITRDQGARTRAVFPSPDYAGMNFLIRDIGFAFPRTSPQYRAYVHVDFRHPGYWTAMLYDGVALAAQAVRDAAVSAASPADTAASPAAVSPSAQAGLSSTAGALGPAGTTGTAAAPALVASNPVGKRPAAASPPAGASAAQARLPLPSRAAVRSALLAIPGYRGIRGDVKFNADREPSVPKAMIYFALKRVDSREMVWKQRAYGPPF